MIVDARLADLLGAVVGGSGILGFRGPAIAFAVAGLVSGFGGCPRDRLRSALAGTAGTGFGVGSTGTGFGVGSIGIGAGSLAEFLDRLLSGAMGRGV